jgi:hypothetical protein
MSTRGAGKISILLAGMLCLLVGAASVLGYQMWTHKNTAPPAGFIDSCVNTDKPNPRKCGSRESIRAHFSVDVDAAIERRRALMESTARRIASGELQRQDLYQACIARKECASVPLLPAGVAAADIAEGKAHLKTRKAFWQLAQGEALSPEICDYIDVCRAMHKAGVVTFK